MEFQSCLGKLIAAQNLTREEARSAFELLFSERLQKNEMKAFLLLLAKKGETAEEVGGCLDALRRHEPARSHGIKGVLDTCGTGSDGSRSINVSTLAAIVIAGAGGKVAKHGNRAITSICGSSDLMEALGVRIESKAETMIAAIRQSGLGYFHAPSHHPVFSKLQPVRRALRTRTVLNLLGPLANPLKLDYQIVGVSRAALLQLYADVLKNSGLRAALVCMGEDGVDEISLSASTRAIFVKGRSAKKIRIHPRQLGLTLSKPSAVRCRSVEESRRLSLELLKGKLRGPVRDIVVLNAGAGLWVSGKAKTLKQGIQMANRSIDNGRALGALKHLVRISKGKR